MKKLLLLFSILLICGISYGIAQETPNNWAVKSSALTCEKEETQVHEGTYSAKMTWTSTSNQDFESDEFSVSVGTFLLKAKAYDNDAAGRVRLCVVWNTGNSYWGYSSDQSEWQTLEKTDAVPDGATTAKVRFRFYDVSDDWDGDATVYLDSVSFTIDSGSNLVLNPGFETWGTGGPATPYTIAQIQTTPDGLPGDSPHKDEFVETNGIVTGIDNNGYFIQDGDGAWNGIWVYDATNAPLLTLGDDITIEGTVEEYNEMTEISGVTSLTTNSTGNDLPAVEVLTSAAFNDEKYEGVLVSVEEAECTNADLGNGEWEVNDGSGAAIIDDLMYAYTPTLGTIYTVIGNGYFSFSNYKIEPRFESDITVISSIDRLAENTMLKEFQLHANYPNPFNPVTTLKFDVPENTENLQLIVFDMLGKKVKTLHSGNINRGQFSATWNGTNESGNPMPSGVYFAVLNTKNFSQSVKMMLIK